MTRRWHVLTYADGRRRVVDVVFLVVAVGFGLLILLPTAGAHSQVGLVLDVVLGSVACLALAVRRRWPTAVAVFAVAASAVSGFSAGASLVALFSAAIRVRPAVTAALTTAELLATFCFPLVYPEPAGFGYGIQVLLGSLVNLGVVGWGLMVRAQRGHLRAVLDGARELELRQELLAATVRDQERRAIAREMHDTLAHRLSLLSVHAGAIEFRADLSPERTRELAAVIRQTSHDALNDLRDVILLLRDGRAGEANPLEPRVGLDGLADLVDQSRLGGTEVTLDQSVDDARGPAAGATVYRIVQECLTNARKHAPGSPVRIMVSAPEPTEIAVTVRTLLGSPTGIPGTGTGLSGLAERVSLLGGTFTSGVVGHQFVVSARLPWGT